MDFLNSILRRFVAVDCKQRTNVWRPRWSNRQRWRVTSTTKFFIQSRQKHARHQKQHHDRWLQAVPKTDYGTCCCNYGSFISFNGGGGTDTCFQLITEPRGRRSASFEKGVFNKKLITAFWDTLSLSLLKKLQVDRSSWFLATSSVRSGWYKPHWDVTCVPTLLQKSVSSGHVADTWQHRLGYETLPAYCVSSDIAAFVSEKQSFGR